MSSKIRENRLAASKRYRDYHKDVLKEKAVIYRKANPDIYRKSAIRHYWKHKQRIFAKRFGVTEEFLAAMPQHCEICMSTVKLCVDHCHQSNYVRGTLCDACNRAIGFFREDTNSLLLAIAYLKKHNKEASDYENHLASNPTPRNIAKLLRVIAEKVDPIE